ncbi:hypothetical protein GCM10010303_43490 [Streptomyces purpurascens]|nr:hypothetical protein GCM10010303_43490 [Streptomyces purpurascens]
MSSVTPGKPLETRETVWEETLASWATSAMDAPWRGRAVRLLVRLVPPVLPGSLSPFTVPTCPSLPSPRNRREKLGPERLLDP